MRLLFISNLYPPLERGGYEQNCQELAVRLREHGHHITVLTSNYGVRDNAVCEDDVFRVLHLEADVYHYRPIDFFVRRQAQTRQNRHELRRVIDQVRPELILVFGMWNLSRRIPQWAEEWLPGRVAYYISSTWPADPDIHQEYWSLPARHAWSKVLKLPFRALALKQLKREGYPPLLKFEHAMCVSHYVRKVLLDTRLISAESGVIYNGLDPAIWLKHAHRFDAQPHNPLRLVYTGSLDPIKGVHTAIEALGILKQRGLAEQLQYTIIGAGHPDYEMYLRRLVDQFEIDNQVRFAGRIARDAMPEALSCHDVFLFTSCGPEAMARTVMEAMAAGLMVIGAETGGQVEMLTHGQNALTFKAEDAAGLAAEIELVLTDPVMRVRLARAGQQTVMDGFTLDRMASGIENWLQGILSENSSL
jgi:glycosyltransferase involved in cell wall biosynthesis